MDIRELLEEFEMKMYGTHFNLDEDTIIQNGYGSYVQIGDDKWNMEVVEVLHGKDYDPKKVFHWYDLVQEILNFYNPEYERLLLDRFKNDIKDLLK